MISQQSCRKSKSSPSRQGLHVVGPYGNVSDAFSEYRLMDLAMGGKMAPCGGLLGTHSSHSAKSLEMPFLATDQQGTPPISTATLMASRISSLVAP